MLPGYVDWETWRGIFTDPALWRGPVERVLNLHGLALREIHPGFPGTSAAFRADCFPPGAEGAPVRLVVKFYPPMAHRDFEQEVEVRTALRDCGSPVPYPRVLFSGVLRDRIDWPYIVEEFRPGQAVRETWHAMSRDERDSVAVQVADVLAALHATPLELLPSLGLSARSWRETSRQRARTSVDALGNDETHSPYPSIPKALLDRLRAFMTDEAERVIDAVPDSALSLLHNDMTEDHVLVERDRPEDPWRVTALLDYGDAKVGAVEEEWIVLWIALFERDTAAMRTFLARYAALAGNAGATQDIDDPAFRARLLVFAMLHNFNRAIICEAAKKAGVDIASVTSVESLLDVLCPID